MNNLGKTYFFYMLHSCREATCEFDYLKQVEIAIKNKSALALSLCNVVQDIKRRRDIRYQLDNGIDVRDLYFTGEIKEISSESYNEILADDENIMLNMSKKSRKLLTDFGFSLNGWHRPLKVQVNNINELESALSKKLGFNPKIIWKNEQ